MAAAVLAKQPVEHLWNIQPNLFNNLTPQSVLCTLFLPLFYVGDQTNFQFRANCQTFDNLIVNSECSARKFTCSSVVSQPRPRYQGYAQYEHWLAPPPGHGNSDKSTLLCSARPRPYSVCICFDELLYHKFTFCLTEKSLQKKNRNRKILKNSYDYFSSMHKLAFSQASWPFLLLFLIIKVRAYFCQQNFCFCKFCRQVLWPYTNHICLRMLRTSMYAP